MTNESQNKAILAHLQTGKALTSRGAFSLFNCMRLSARIYELTQRGHDITSSRVVTNDNKRIARYSMKGESV